MSWLSRVCNVFRESAVDRDIDDELRFHLEARIEDLQRRGLTADEATAEARRRFGDLSRLREDSQDVKRQVWLASLGRDIRYAGRLLRRSPGFATAAILSLALGIGTNTATFTLLDQVLLRPLPVQRPHDLALVRIEGAFHGTTAGDGNEISYPMFVEFREHNDAFSGMFARFGRTVHVGIGDRTDRVNAELVSGSYFDVLGVHAIRGRVIGEDDDRVPGGHPVAVLSYDCWRNRFGSAEHVVGRALTVNGHPYTIVGVAQEGFAGMNVGSAAQLFVPMMMQPHVLPGWRFLEDRRSRFAQVYGRLRPGVSHAQAQASLQPYFRAIRERELTDSSLSGVPPRIKEEFLSARIQVEPGFQGIARLRRTLARPLWILTGLAIGLLLATCANLSTLLIARSAARQREIAIRLSLGGSRARIVQQLMVEALVLATAGAAAGLLVSQVGGTALQRLMVDPELSANVTASLDGRTVGFSAAVSTAVAIVVGLIPAWPATRVALARAMKEQCAGASGTAQQRLRRTLVVAQVSLSLFLLAGAGLFVRTLDNLMAQDLGFERDHLVSFRVDAALNGYSGSRGAALHKMLLERLETLPGVSNAALATIPLLQGYSWQSTINVEGYVPHGDEEIVGHINAVTPGYFQAMGIALLSGRTISDRDRRSEFGTPEGSPFRVAVINQRFANLYFGTGNPIGRHIGFGGAADTPPSIEIVGVVADTKYRSIRDAVEPQVFLSFFEHPGPDGATAYLRTAVPPEQMFDPLRRMMREIDPALPLFRLRTMDQTLDRSVSNERLIASLSATFGVFAALLAGVGIYGVIAYAVLQRRREIGIRLALGARPGQVTWLFLRDSLTLVAVGCAGALPLVWITARYAQSQLYGVEPVDPVTLVGAVAVVLTIAVASCALPATHGARIEPLAALKD
jgi:predicted permease